ncbi:MAG: N-acetylglutaminylglutamine synthetase [Gammaproteobacteria bacterium]|nr:N-acetylglutaminylglutamine synthetase [Gammaproteobacteria bacterium]
MPKSEKLRHRLKRSHSSSFHNRKEIPPHSPELPDRDVVIDCGWGRLIFGQTFSDTGRITELLRTEEAGKRDIALYLQDPHVAISLAPHELFLDPSHTYRLWLERYRPDSRRPKGFSIRLLQTLEDAEAIREIYLKRKMVPPPPPFVWHNRANRNITYLVAEDEQQGNIIGVVMGIDHAETFNDPENGSSLWALAIDAQTHHLGIGESLVRHLAEHYLARGRDYMDLSVMHDNTPAIKLYERLGFVRVPFFALKRKNSWNEPLFMAPQPDEELNPYAMIIINEARRRGIGVEIIDKLSAYFTLTFGGRSIICRESLSELTTAVAMSRCDDKTITSRVLAAAGLRVPQQTMSQDEDHNRAFLQQQRRLVVKPARGEQGAGISVDIQSEAALKDAIAIASQHHDKVILEEFCEGADLRILVINYKVVAAAVRKPATITGDGKRSIAELITKQSQRRAAATGGESKIPVDSETIRSIEEQGFTLDSILPVEQRLQVRKTANLHTGGTLHDVTEMLSHTLVRAAIDAARAIGIPVVGLDLLVPSVDGKEYVIIEANERPGLANHEPQPTAKAFIDLLFPQTMRQQ